jgi:hypothetical protein
MGPWIGVALLGALLFWLFMPARRRSMPSPEDDVNTPIDHAELEEAERELQQDPRPRALEHGVDDDEDDWGPGTGR